MADFVSVIAKAFEMNVLLEYSSVIIAILSVSVAVWSAKKSNSTRKEQVLLQIRVVELEELKEKERKEKDDRADLRAVVQIAERIDGFYRKATHIQIENNGKNTATNIRLFVNGDPVTQHGYMMRHNSHRLNDLNPDGPCMWGLYIIEVSPKTCEIELRWDDKTGKDYSWKEPVDLRSDKIPYMK